VTIRIPALRPGTASNVLGAVGLVGIVVSIGMLAGWPWAMLAGGIVAIALALIAQNAQTVDDAAHRLLNEPMRPAPAGAPNLEGAPFVPAKQFARASHATT
jgi:hypothetical protein